MARRGDPFEPVGEFAQRRAHGLARRRAAVARHKEVRFQGGEPPGGGVALVAAVTKDSGLNAAELIAEPARTVGGGGGKSPDLAIAGGRDASRLDGTVPDPRLQDAIDLVRAARQPDGTWLQGARLPGRVWVDIDVPAGEPSKWLTLIATRVLDWWDESDTDGGADPTEEREDDE